MTAPTTAIVGARFQVEGDDAVVRAIRELTNQMQQARQTATGMSREVGTGFIKLGTSAEGAAKGAKKLETGFADLARSAVGLSGSQSKLVEGLLLLGGGSTAVLGVAAGVALIGVAYQKLTEDARKAREEQEKLLDALLKVREERLRAGNPAETFQKAVDAAEAEAKRLQNQLTAQRQLVAVATPGDLPVQERHLKDLEDQLRDVQHAVEQAVITRDEARARQLAALRDAGLAKDAELAELAALRAQAQVTATLGRTDEERLRAANLLKETAEAEAKGRERSASAAHDQLTAEQRLAADALRASAKQVREEEDRRRRALGANDFLPTRTTFEPNVDLLQQAADRALSAPSPIIGQIGRVDPAALAAQVDLITAKSDTLLTTLNGLKLAVQDVEGEFATGALNAVEDFFARGISSGENFLDLLRNIVAEFQAIATHALFQQLFGATLTVATAGASGGGSATAGHDFAESIFFAEGGVVPGSGSGDTVPAMLTPGEGVLTVREMTRLGAGGFHALREALGGDHMLPAIHLGRQYFASGGIVAEPGGSARVDGRIEVSAAPGTTARVVDGDILRVVRDNPRAMKQALGLRD